MYDPFTFPCLGSAFHSVCRLLIGYHRLFTDHEFGLPFYIPLLGFILKKEYIFIFRKRVPAHVFA